MSYWYRQDKSKPLFPELEWSRPENRIHAGKLLIVGGNLHGFSAPANAFNEADKAGIGMTRVILPNAIQKSVKTFMPEADFAPSTPSGSFASESLDMFLENAAWADAVLVAGDLGRNSETAIVLEKFIVKYHEALVLTKDAVDYFTENPHVVIDRPETLIVASFAQLQRIAMSAKFEIPLTYDMDLLHFVEAMHLFSKNHNAHVIVKHHDVYVAAVSGNVSTTNKTGDQDIWRVATAAAASVWWLQHKTKPFEAITQGLLS